MGPDDLSSMIHNNRLGLCLDLSVGCQLVFVFNV